MSADLGPYLDRLVELTSVADRLDNDPVGFVHWYSSREDQEVAAILAGTLAYGRVSAFKPVLAALFRQADRAGGPRAWVDDFDPERHGEDLRPLIYRFNRGVDWVLLLSGLQTLYRRTESLEDVLPAAEPLPRAVDHLIDAIREAVVAQAPRCGVEATEFSDLPRGLRYLLPRPRDGSATKRWWMIMRWLVRRPTHGIDLGLWRSREPAELVIPLDTHVLRVSRFLGLTERTVGSFRAAVQVTDRLRELDPVDPVRYDFAMAHLGISGSCRGHRLAGICRSCPLDPVCRAV